jgi:DNA-directed RNA polymerase subunit RPC12/RpoP
VGSNVRLSYQKARRRLEGKQTMIYFKACPKCHGDVEFITAPQEYKALQCMQCGFMVDNQKGKVVMLAK